MNPQEKALKKQYLAYILDTLEPHAPVTARAMFGGYGIYLNSLIIGVIVENQIYFKIDNQTRPDYEELHAEPLVFAVKNKTVTMPYMNVPESILENRDELPQWLTKAYQVAVRSKK